MNPSAFIARLDPCDTAFEVAAGQSLLEAAAFAGIGFSSSCRNGTCRSCICLLLSGQVSYRIEWPGLLPEEKAQGWILPCVAYAQSNLVISRPGQ